MSRGGRSSNSISKAVERLSAVAVQKASKPGAYHAATERGLYFHIGPTGGKSWLLRYQIDGKPRWMGLGPYPEIGLARAREKALEARRLKAEGVDPLDQRAAKRSAAAAAAAKEKAAAVTFREACGQHRGPSVGVEECEAWAQWTATLETYAFPLIGADPVGAVETGHLTQILEPIWNTKSETASRVRGRIEAVLDYAKTHGWRTGENPARWKGHLENVLAKKRRMAGIMPFLPWKEISAFMGELARQEGMGALALRFAILTAARTSEVIGAQWSEIDLRDGVWTVPPERMKAGKEHRVPLSGPVLDTLRGLAKLGTEGFVFPGMRRGRGLSNMALLATLRRMKRDDLTAHGFRRDVQNVVQRHWKTDRSDGGGARRKANFRLRMSAPISASRRVLMTQWAEWCSQIEAAAQ